MKTTYIAALSLGIVATGIGCLIITTADAVIALQQASETSTSAFLPSNSYEAAVNEERRAAGLTPLKSSSLLKGSACMKANDMVTKEYWSHIAPDGTAPWEFFDEVGYDYDLAGENLAKGYADDRSAVAAWMASPTHRENILDDFTEQGICVQSGIVVQHLGTRR